MTIKLGDKPLAEMTAEEMLEAVATLRAEREELRAEAVRRKREEHTTPAPRKPPKVKAPVDTFMADFLEQMKGD